MLSGPVGKCTCSELLSGVDIWEILRVCEGAVGEILRVCEGAVRRPLEDGASDCVELMLTRSHQTLFGPPNQEERGGRCV